MIDLFSVNFVAGLGAGSIVAAAVLFLFMLADEAEERLHK